MQSNSPNSNNSMENLDFDLYDADLENSDYNNRVIELTEIEKTKYFCKLDFYPVNLAEMDYFLRQLDLIGVFNDLTDDNITEMNPSQLDCLYICVKYISIEVIKFCENIIRNYFEEWFRKEFNALVNDKINVNISNALVDEICIEMGQRATRFITIYQPYVLGELSEDKIDFLTKKIVTTMRRLLNSDYCQQIMTTLDINVGFEFFHQNGHHFRDYVYQSVSYYKEKCASTFDQIRKLATILKTSKPETDILTIFQSELDIDKIIQSESDSINSFCYMAALNLSPEDVQKESVQKISEYDNFLYDSDRRTENAKHAFWVEKESLNYTSGTMSQLEKIKQLAEERGYYVEDTKLDSFFSAFVQSGLIDSEQILFEQIAELLTNARNKNGVYSLYDNIDLETAYVVSAIGNNIDISYDEFIGYLANFELPKMYPLEFLCQLISRILNIQIELFDNRIECVHIDNRFSYIMDKPIQICQIWGEYYLMYATYFSNTNREYVEV